MRKIAADTSSLRNLSVLLVSANPNRHAFVPPYGLELVGAALARNGARVCIVDPFLVLPGERDWRVDGQAPDFVGVGFRNLDSHFVPLPHAPWVDGRTNIDELCSLVKAIQGAGVPSGRIVLGGAGFSIAPRQLLERSGLEYGVVGPGERSLPLLIEKLLDGGDPAGIPGVVTVHARAPRPAEICGHEIDAPPTTRLVHRHIALARKVPVPLRTRVGCGFRCSFCCEAHTQPARARLRSLGAIEEEIRWIRECGNTEVFIADSEFNSLSMAHTKSVLRLLIRCGLKWKAYMLPSQYDRELLELIGQSRCAGVIVAVDSASDTVMRRVGRPVRAAVRDRFLEELASLGVNTQATLLFGLPGETSKTIRETVEFARRHPRVRFNYLCGVRVYPGTALHSDVVDIGSSDVYGPGPAGDFLQLRVFCQPCTPWRLYQEVRALSGGVPNLVPEFPAAT